MKTLIRKTMLVALSSLSLTAFADVGKTPLRVNFNQLIEEGAQDRRQIHEGLTESTDTASREPVAPKREARGSVIDFIDMEVGVGENAHVVDRR